MLYVMYVPMGVEEGGGNEDVDLGYQKLQSFVEGFR